MLTNVSTFVLCILLVCFSPIARFNVRSYLIILLHTRVVTVRDFLGMIIVSENIAVSWYMLLNNQNSFFFWLNKCLEACAYSNFINQKQSSKFNH